MSQVVQAACPGCKSILRIPADWVGQPIRCKSCGVVMQAKAPAKTPPSPPPVPQRKPAPPPAAPPRQAQRAVQVAPLDPSPFAFGEEEEEVSSAPRPRARRRSKGGVGPWIGLAVAGTILAMTAATAFVVYNKIIKPRQDAAASDDDEKPSKAKGKGDGPATFPRRAMIVSVHNYLYANPIVDSPGDSPNLERLKSSLNRGLRVPLDQIIHLSDAARKDARPPLKPIIEQGLRNFLETSRKQDRVMVFFVGHTKEIDNEAYLVPLEGELDNAATLIPLKWVYEQMAKCPARQKVLVIDGNRINAGQGEERPASGPMGEKFAAMLKAPPAGVQVWSACGAGQQSAEFEESSLGLFLDSVRLALTPENGAKGALDGRIQNYDDLLPLEPIQAFVNERMAAQSKLRKSGEQVAILSGKAAESGAEFDRTEGPAKTPALPNVTPGDLTLVRAILSEISVPSLKGGEGVADVPFAILPRFPDEVLKQYEGGDLPEDSKLRASVRQARAALWAVSAAKAPKELADEVAAQRKMMRFDISVMRDRYPVPSPADVERFKGSVIRDLEPMARIIKRMEDVLDELRAVGGEREAAPKRWQVNYDFILARCQATLAYLEDYQGQLGQLRRDLPEHDPAIHTGFRLASSEKATDASGKKLERAARKLYGELAKDNPKTPWEVLAKRERLTALGLTWKAF